MTNDKAREFFSAYFEGSLDGSLRQALEQKLRTDVTLASDYAAFSETMNELDSMQLEEIEVPLFLSDRIATRLEEVQAKRTTPAFSWLRLVQGGSVAAVAVVATILVWQGFGRSEAVDTMQGSTIPIAAMDADQLRFNYADGKVTVNYRPSSSRTVLVSSGSTHEVLNRFHLSRQQELSSPLSNTLPGTALFEIKVVDDADVALVAVPGTSTTREPSGSGSVKDLAAALAEFYRVPVLLQAERIETPVTWNFRSTEPRTEATEILRDLGFSVDLRPSGMIVIMDR